MGSGHLCYDLATDERTVTQLDENFQHSNGARGSSSAPFRLDMGPIWSALASLSRCAWPPPAAGDATRLVLEANQHYLLALLDREPDLPPLVRTALDQHRAMLRAHAMRQSILQQEMARFAGILGREEFVVLKGWDYATRVYPERTLRPMADLDVLVPDERSPAVAALLHANGYQERNPSGANPRWYHERVFFSERALVEVHRGFIQAPRTTIDYAAVWKRRVPFPEAGANAFRLENIDAIVHHALSMSNEEFSVRLIRYVDFALLLESDRVDILEVAARAAEWSTRRALYGALRTTSLFFPEITPLYEAAAPHLLSRRTRAFLDTRIIPDPRVERGGHQTGRFVQLWRKLFLLDDWSRRIAFAASAVRGRL